MQVARLDARFLEVLRQIFRHALGQCGDQHPFVFLCPLLNLFDQIINLIQAWTHFNDGIKKSRWTDDLLHKYTRCLLQFIIGGGSTYINHLLLQLLKLFVLKRSVIHGCRQSKAKFNQVLFSASIPTIHGVYLG